MKNRQNIIAKSVMCVLGVLGFSVAAMTAKADPDIIPTFHAINVVGGLNQVTYSVQLTNGERLNSAPAVPEYFTIYDFAGFVAGTNFQPLDWTFVSSPIGYTDPSLLSAVHDNPGIPNLTWEYTGTAPLVGPLDLGLFGASSTYSQLIRGNFSAVALGNDPSDPTQYNQPIGNIGPVAVLATPEAASVALLLPGLLPLGLVLRRRNAARKTALA